MGLFGKLFGRGKKATPSKKGVAYRGRGGGYLTEDEVADFLEGEPITVTSSNVGVLVQYHPDARKMMVEFLPKGRRPGSAYMYSDVSGSEAESFARASSKGEWIWDNFRVRGTRDGHRKPYVRIR